MGRLYKTPVQIKPPEKTYPPYTLLSVPYIQSFLDQAFITTPQPNNPLLVLLAEEES